MKMDYHLSVILPFLEVEVCSDCFANLFLEHYADLQPETLEVH